MVIISYVGGYFPVTSLPFEDHLNTQAHQTGLRKVSGKADQ